MIWIKPDLLLPLIDNYTNRIISFLKFNKYCYGNVYRIAADNRKQAIPIKNQH
jgi:hypothetical protein